MQSSFRPLEISPERESPTNGLILKEAYVIETIALLQRRISELYVRDFDDTDSVASVSDVEQLSTGLSRKIWQKIMILEQSIHRLVVTGEVVIDRKLDKKLEGKEEIH